jgi:hypothetical protein
MSYLRDKTRPQADRSIYHTQKNFGGGLNADVPATDINTNELANSQNYIWEERWGDGRPGSVEVADITGTGAGDIHGKPFYHPKEKCLIFHRGGQLWRWDGASAVEIKKFAPEGGIEASFGENGDSNIEAFGEDAMIFTQSGFFYRIILRENTNNVMAMNNKNDGQPRDLTQDISDVDMSTPFRYKYAYTFSCILESDGDFVPTDRLATDARVIWESPPVSANDINNVDESYFRLMEFNLEPKDSGKVLNMGTVDEASVPAFTYISHVSWYRTVELGQNGIDNETNEEYGWIGDALIDRVTPTNTQLTDGTADDVVRARILSSELRLTNIGWVPTKADEDLSGASNPGSIGSVNEQFIFTAETNAQNLAYSQRVKDQLVGYHSGIQSHVFNDGIRILGNTPDVLTIVCNKTTHITTLTSVINSGILQSEFVLDHFDDIDKNIGVQDTGSFVEVEQGTYIAICSDRSVRVWDGAGWGSDLALNKVGKDLISKAFVGRSVGVYSDGAYIVWFDSEDTGSVNQCLRLSVKRSSGKGWTRYTGANWVLPINRVGVFTGDSFLVDDGIGVNFTFAIDAVDNKIYWIEPFIGPEGATINGFEVLPYYADKVSSASPNGFSIECRFKPRETTGARESFNIIHQESHAYMRDTVDPTETDEEIPITYPELKVDARAFVDGKLSSVETEGQVNPGDDIQFWYRISGSRIAIEFFSNRSGHRVVKNDTRFRVQDILRPGRAPSDNVSVDFQDDFQTGLNLWVFSRPAPFRDRVQLKNLSANGKSTIPGPDARSKGVRLASTTNQPIPYIKPNTTVFDAFTFSLWTKTVELLTAPSAILLKINGASGNSDLTITITPASSISTVEFGGAVAANDPDTAPGNLNGWSQFIFVREAGDTIMNVYQNDALIGTLPVNTGFGGGQIQIGGFVP